MILLDDYERSARLAPGLLVAAPLAIAVLGCGLKDIPVVSSLTAVLVACGGPLLLANTVRDRGVALQERLFTEWGGAPTTSALRLRESTSNQPLRDLWRAGVEAVSGTQLLRLEDEQRDPVDADRRIEAAVAVARERTRDRTKYGMVFAENVNFGFERNLLSMRPFGLTIALLSALACIGAAGFRLVVVAGPMIAAVINALLCLVWLIVPTKSRVRRAGTKYAEQLLSSVASQ